MRRTIIAGNWKMHKTVPEAVGFARELKIKSIAFNNIDIVICPTFTTLVPVWDIIRDSKIKLGAQNIHWAEQGAFTGEVSASMIETCGCSFVIIGHSERRQLFGETDGIINKKLKRALTTKLIPIFCVGETLEQRKSKKTEQVIDAQIRLGLDGINIEVIKRVIIAYEPVWAIGTGETATPEQAEEVHSYIRQLIANLYNYEIAENLRIQYGGSVKPTNAKELLSQKDIDGALIGGASLEIESFIEIIKIAEIINLE